MYKEIHDDTEVPPQELQINKSYNFVMLILFHQELHITFIGVEAIAPHLKVTIIAQVLANTVTVEFSSRRCRFRNFKQDIGYG